MDVTSLARRANALVARGCRIAADLLASQGDPPKPVPDPVSIDALFSSAERVSVLHVRRNEPAEDFDGIRHLMAVVTEFNEILLEIAEKLVER